jgi:hypothetical protein
MTEETSATQPPVDAGASFCCAAKQVLLQCNSVGQVRIIDDFLPDAAAVRQQGLHAPYEDWLAPDGEVYRRICRVTVPQAVQQLERHLGPIELYAMGFRLNFAGELPNAAVHSDAGWQHRATGAHRLDPGDQELWHQVRDDWNRPAAWQQAQLAELKFNRAVIYEGSLFHSRWPFEAFGTGPEDGRLTLVAFFTPKAN